MLLSLARGLIVIGIICLIAGGALYLLARFNVPIGRLPGDIRLEGEGYVVYIPLVSMVLISLLLTCVLNVLARLVK